MAFSGSQITRLGLYGGPRGLYGSFVRVALIDGHPYVVTKASNSNAATTSHTVTLPSGIASGNLLLAFLSAQSGGATTWPAGWTELEDSFHAGFAWREADGTEGASITVTTANSVASSAACYRIDAHEDPDVQAPQTSSVVGGIGNPNPPSFSPTGGSKKYLYIAFHIRFGAETIVTYPTNYDLDRIDQTSAAGDLGLAARQLEAASDNPSNFILSGSETYNAYTLAVHPPGGRVVYAGFTRDVGRLMNP